MGPRIVKTSAIASRLFSTAADTTPVIQSYIGLLSSPSAMQPFSCSGTCSGNDVHALWDLLAKYQPELLIQLAVLVSCWLASLVFDLFGSTGVPDTHTRQIVFMICVPVGFVISMFLWGAIDDPDHDKEAVRIIISALGSITGGLGAPYFNRAVAALIKWKWPGLAIDTAFKP